MKLDIKNIVITILVCCLVALLFFGKKIIIDETESRLKLLHDANITLIKNNESLYLLIGEQNDKIEEAKKLLEENNNELEKSRKEIKRLKNEKNKIYPITKRMSADNVAITFSKYLDKRTEGKDICK